jgi:hypothetical protein
MAYHPWHFPSGGRVVDNSSLMLKDAVKLFLEAENFPSYSSASI